MLNKNDVVTVEITDIGVGGEGIGRVDGYTLFIKDAIIGDVVEAKVMKAKKNYGYARMMEIIHPSADRVEPKCAFARKCGGCQIQEMSYERQLAFKEQKIRGNLERIGGFDRGKIDAVMEPVEGMDEPFRYRNKAQFPFGTDKEGNPVTGFYAGRTHDIIANTECILGVEQNREILEIILQYMKENCVAAYDEKSGKGLIRHVLIRYGFTTKEIMVCLVINGTKLPKADRLIKKLTQLEGMTSITLSPNTRRDNVIMGNSYEVLWGQGFITDYIGNVKYQISPLSFYQVNPVQTEKLYGLALEYADLKGTETVWDLYCGIGTISLFLAQKAKQVYGVEIVPQAIEDAKNNAKINEINNAAFYVGKAEEVLPDYYEEYAKTHGGEKARADVIVVDPPRKGCDETLLETIVKMEPEKVVYVSCLFPLQRQFLPLSVILPETFLSLFRLPAHPLPALLSLSRSSSPFRPSEYRHLARNLNHEPAVRSQRQICSSRYFQAFYPTSVHKRWDFLPAFQRLLYVFPLLSASPRIMPHLQLPVYHAVTHRSRPV